jgi:hypothetical protein
MIKCKQVNFVSTVEGKTLNEVERLQDLMTNTILVTETPVLDIEMGGMTHHIPFTSSLLSDMNGAKVRLLEHDKFKTSVYWRATTIHKGTHSCIVDQSVMIHA